MVSWTKIKKDRKFGGLGVRGLRNMNDALLLKWWWRFGSEKEALWRQVICSKYKMNINNWFPLMEANGNTSLAWKDILLIKNKRPTIFTKFMENIRLSVGNGKNIKFWMDPWANVNSLRSSFPRIFNICLQKDETIADVWNRKESDGSWSFQFRRRVFGWEQEDYNNLIAMLDELYASINPNSEFSDHLSWEACSSKIFSVSSLYKIVSSHGILSDESDRKILQLIWNCKAPLKVQCFGWMAFLGKLKTGEHLLRIGILTNYQDALCKFCGECIESINHSLLHCFMTWKIWCKILGWWGIQWVLPPSLSDLFLWWGYHRHKSMAKSTWECIPLAILWSLWKMRNEFLFQNSPLNWDDLLELIKIRIAFWIKNSENSDYSINDFLFNLRSMIHSP